MSIKSKLINNFLDLNNDKETSQVTEGKSQTAHETIKNIMLDKKYNLSSYRSLKSKIELLDEAILTLDGNCIVMVSISNYILFLTFLY